MINTPSDAEGVFCACKIKYVWYNYIEISVEVKLCQTFLKKLKKEKKKCKNSATSKDAHERQLRCLL